MTTSSTEGGSNRLQLTEIEQQAVIDYNGKALGSDETNRLLGPRLSYPVYHHFGIGEVPDLEGILQRCDTDEIKRILYELERAESLHLVRLLNGRIRRDSRILDCGSGSGGTAFDFHESYGCFVDGVNIAHEQVALTNRLARERGIADRVSFHVMNMRKTSFDNGTFDAAINNETTMYVALTDLFPELARVIKKGGIYVLISWCKADEHIEDNLYAEQADRHYTTRMHSPLAYQRALAEHGFTIIKFEDLTAKAINYWRLRLGSALATGVEQPFLEGYQKGYLKYISISAVNKDK